MQVEKLMKDQHLAQNRKVTTKNKFRFCRKKQ